VVRQVLKHLGVVTCDAKILMVLSDGTNAVGGKNYGGGKSLIADSSTRVSKWGWHHLIC
jgi:hypothetical protein